MIWFYWWYPSRTNTRHVHPCCGLSQACLLIGCQEVPFFLEVKSIELVIYLTIHVALEIELDTAVGTGVGCCPVVGPEAGRVAAEGQDPCPVARTAIAKPVHQKLFFPTKKLRVFPGILLQFFVFNCFFKLLLLPLLSFRIVFVFFSFFSVRCLL